MKAMRAPCGRLPLVLGAVIMMISASASAEIYKWVDANGRTHFSERPASGAQSVDTTGKPASASPARASDPTAQSEYWQERERQFRERQLDKRNEKPPAAVAAAPKSLSGGKAGNSDQSRCKLARDILNGAVKHSNGKPVDQYDRDVAASDVRAFCH